MDQFTSEALNVNRAAQRANNKARIRELHSYAIPGFARVFDLVPLLLHQNPLGLTRPPPSGSNLLRI